MNIPDLCFPVFDDRNYPPPTLTMDQYMQRLADRVKHMSEAERKAMIDRDEQLRVMVRFRL